MHEIPQSKLTQLGQHFRDFSFALDLAGKGPVTLVSQESIGALAKKTRKELGLSQQDFADLAGVGRRFISELEAGKETLEIGKVLQVCRAAGIDLLAVKR